MKRTITIPVRAMLLAALVLIAAGGGLRAGEAVGEPAVRVHYLGHAAFYLRFANGLSVLADYGKSRAYGLDSPVYGIGMRTPDVATYSHRHEDHAGGPLGKGVPFILWGDRPLALSGLAITPIPTHERDLAVPDNFSFRFEFQGRTILHLGDCQALILACDRPEVQSRIRALYPGPYDVVMLPIGFIDDILEPAARFLDLLSARVVIPMHYWNPADKQAFLTRLQGRKRPDGTGYEIRELAGAQWSLEEPGPPSGAVVVLSLTPASFTGW